MAAGPQPSAVRPPSAADIGPLIEAAVGRWYLPRTPGGPRIVGVDSETITRGVSGAEVRRHTVHLSGSGRVVRLVTKMSDRTERMALAHLNAQGHGSVPASHCRRPERAGPDWLCLQDLGDTGRPDVLSGIPEDMLASEITGLAAIHAANLGAAAAGLGDWLPPADRGYAASMIEEIVWRPNWDSAVAQNDFHEEFSSWLPRVEAAAAKVADEMGALYAEADTRTLVHTDVNPGNVLVHGGRAYFIDWADAHLGPFYLDLPHHLHTAQLAERYRQALAAAGHHVASADFVERWRVAARYTALRNMWWAIEAWREERDMAGWVLHYFGMLDA
jgi:hypothetical protein